MFVFNNTDTKLPKLHAKDIFVQKVKCRYINTNTISIFMDFYTIISNSGDDEVGELSCSCLREPQTSTIQDFNSETFEYQHHR